MSCPTNGKVSEDQNENDGKEMIMYYCNMPVIKVQNGTTLGLAKMLYESIKGGDGKLIGLKPRQSSPGLVCIITQDSTILTEKEYDIILHVDNKVTEHTAEANSRVRMHDKSVNTLITFKTYLSCERLQSLMCRVSETSPSSDARCSDKTVTGTVQTKRHLPSADESSAMDCNCKVNVRTVCSDQNVYVVDWKYNQAEKLCIDRKYIRATDAVISDRNDAEYLQHITAPNSQDSSSTTYTAVWDTDSPSSEGRSSEGRSSEGRSSEGRSSEGSPKCSPSQVYQPPLYQRKPSDEELDSAGNVDQSEDGRSDMNGLPRWAAATNGEQKKWQCLYCLKSFLCRSALENHQRTHTGEKPFQCTHCGRAFSHQGNLKQHLHIHRDVKPHICDVCGKGFTRSNRLRDHRLSHGIDTDKNCKIYVNEKFEWN